MYRRYSTQQRELDLSRNYFSFYLSNTQYIIIYFNITLNIFYLFLFFIHTIINNNNNTKYGGKSEKEGKKRNTNTRAA